MIHLFSMRQLMDYNIIEHIFGGKDQPPVVVEISLAGAASPSRFLFPDGDASVGDVHDGCIVSGFLCENISCYFNVTAALPCGKRLRGRLWSLLRFLDVFEYPGFFFFEKTVDGGSGAVLGGADFDAALRCDLYGQCFPAAVYNFI